jgi:hypothetical protein
VSQHYPNPHEVAVPVKDIKWIAPVPRCDVCESAPGAIDGPTIMGPHANMCEDCFADVGIPSYPFNTRKVEA